MMIRPVSVTQFRLIQELADEVIRESRNRFGLPSSPPILVDFIAQTLYGLECLSDNLKRFGPRTVGTLSLSERTIFVDKRCTLHQRNFAIAHELGHFVLHEGNTSTQLGIAGEESVPFSCVLRSSYAKSKKARSQLREVEANLFAAALLVPHKYLLNAARCYSIVNHNVIRFLAREFRVSIETIHYRIKDLVEHHLWFGPPVVVEVLRTRNVFRRYGANTSAQNDYKREQQGRVTDIADYKRPYIIEFCGTSNAGKDTLIGIVSDYLQDVHGYKVRVIDEAIKECHLDKPLEIERLYKTIATTVVQLYEAYYENPGNYDYVIFNRGLFDRLALIEAARALKRIPDEQAYIHLNYLLSYTNFIDLILFFQISPEESLKREWSSKRNVVAILAEHEGKSLNSQRILNLETLQTLNVAYLDMYREHKKRFKRIYPLGLYRGDEAEVIERALSLRPLLFAEEVAQPPLPDFIDFAPYEKKRGRTTSTKKAQSIETNNQHVSPTQFDINVAIQHPLPL